MPDLHIKAKTYRQQAKCHLCQEKKDHDQGRRVTIPYGCGLPKEGRTKWVCLDCIASAIHIAVRFSAQQKQEQEQKAG